jgi:hypothetical protein
MKKAFSIVFALTLLLSGLHVTISTHFCEGKIASHKISLSGKSASCGMEKDEDNCPFSLPQLSGSCCTDHVIIAGTSNIFTKTYPIRKYQNEVIQPLTIRNNSQIPSVSYQFLYTGYNPPGIFGSNSVSLENICILLI